MKGKNIFRLAAGALGLGVAAWLCVQLWPSADFEEQVGRYLAARPDAPVFQRVEYPNGQNGAPDEVDLVYAREDVVEVIRLSPEFSYYGRLRGYSESGSWHFRFNEGILEVSAEEYYGHFTCGQTIFYAPKDMLVREAFLDASRGGVHTRFLHWGVLSSDRNIGIREFAFQQPLLGEKVFVFFESRNPVGENPDLVVRSTLYAPPYQAHKR